MPEVAGKKYPYTQKGKADAAAAAAKRKALQGALNKQKATRPRPGMPKPSMPAKPKNMEKMPMLKPGKPSKGKLSSYNG